jgi:hypothetical protein
VRMPFIVTDQAGFPRTEISGDKELSGLKLGESWANKGDLVTLVPYQAQSHRK